MVVAGSTAANEKFSMGRSVSILVVRLAGRTYWMGCLTAILQYTIVMALSRILTQTCKRRLKIFDYTTSCLRQKFVCLSANIFID